LTVSFLQRTYNHFEKITDPRINRGGNHSLIEMIFVTLCATICDADSWADVERYGIAKLEWLRKFVPLTHGVPSHDTLGRVFARLESVEFYAALQSWATEIAGCLSDQSVALDGKTLRGSFDKASAKSALHSVSAWACGLRLCLGLKSVDAKSNEIPAVQELIDMLDLEGAVVTADAMHCQQEMARALIDKQADYLLMVKGNQPTLQAELHDAIIAAFDDENPALRQHQKKERNRDREEYREVAVVPVPADSPVFSAWTGIQTLGTIYRSRVVRGKLEESAETFITSLPCKVRDITQRIRSHGSIENQQHHVLDVTFSEDASRIRKGTGPEVASVFRRLALGILQQDKTLKDSIRGKRKRCGWDNRALERLIACFQGN
jgi:predicted transposase YbfD/YdcC